MTSIGELSEKISNVCYPALHCSLNLTIISSKLRSDPSVYMDNWCIAAYARPSLGSSNLPTKTLTLSHSLCCL